MDKIKQEQQVKIYYAEKFGLKAFQVFKAGKGTYVVYIKELMGKETCFIAHTRDEISTMLNDIFYDNNYKNL